MTDPEHLVDQADEQLLEEPVDMFAPTYRLTPWQMEILEFERATWASPGRRGQAIIERFGHNQVRHNQVVLHLITIPAAAAYDPQVVGRLTRIRDRRAQIREHGGGR